MLNNVYLAIAIITIVATVPIIVFMNRRIKLRYWLISLILCEVLLYYLCSILRPNISDISFGCLAIIQFLCHILVFLEFRRPDPN